MALINAFTIIRAISLFHLTAAWFFLAAPKKLADQDVVFMLGESMRLPHVTSMDKPSESTAFLAVILAFLGVADLAAASLSEGVAFEYWLANVPVRIAFLFAITGYTYFFKPDGMFGSGVWGRASVGAPLQNSLVFAWGFFELALWFWAFLSLRDERREMARQIMQRRQAEQENLQR